MASLFAEVTQGQSSPVLRLLARRGILPVAFYKNLSAFMGRDIWLFDAPVGTPIVPLATLPGVLYMEPDEEHIFVRSLWRDIYPFGTPSLSLPRILPPESIVGDDLPSIMRLTGVPQLHERGLTGQGTIILVVDSGVIPDRLPASVRVGGWTDDPSGEPWNDDVGHGTFVALIAHAVAPEAGIFPIRLRPGPNGGLMKESVVAAVNALIPFVQENPDVPLVMNNSWGTPGCLSTAEGYW